MNAGIQALNPKNHLVEDSYPNQLTSTSIKSETASWSVLLHVHMGKKLAGFIKISIKVVCSTFIELLPQPVSSRLDVATWTPLLF